MWVYNDVELTEAPEDMVGFVYMIWSHVNGKAYIGQKKFWFKKVKSVKGKRKRVLAESDWRDYWGSNDELKADVAKHGKMQFTRKILHLCKGKAWMNYLELKEQVERKALEDPKLYYNAYVGGRISRKQLGIK